MKTLQVLLLVFVLFGIMLVGGMIVARYAVHHWFSPAPDDSANDPKDNARPNTTVKSTTNKVAAKNPPVAKPETATPREMVGQIRFASDAVYKKKDFWLEQPITFGGETDLTGKPLLKLYVGLDEKTLRSLSVTINGWEAVLESSDGKDAPKHEWARQKLSKFAAGEYDLGILWRRGELSVWINATEVLKWRPDDAAAVAETLALDSAVQVLDANVGLGARRAFAFDTIRFDDNFMRSAANDDWRPASGRWELTSMAFAERSANPFSLRASFNDRTPFDEDDIYKNRTRRDDYGLGVQISVAEGTPHIVRLTGGSPASHAGLAEDDIFIELNGNPVDMTDLGTLHRQLMYGQGDLNLKMYRPGEKTFRQYNIAREAFKWGTSVEGVPIPPVAVPATRAGDEFSFIMAGEAGWSDYEAEVAVKPLGGGGFGLAVAALSDSDCVLFRWRGPYARGETGTGKTNVMQIVRVKDGKETVLAERAAHYRPYEFYRMGVNWTGDKISCLIDKNEMLSATIPDIRRGKIGLYALKGDPVFFDDVHVAGDRGVTSAWHLAERSINSIFALEDDMEVWANPALEWDRDVKTGWSIHNQRFPGDQAISIAKPRFNELNIALYAGAEPESPSCPRLTIRNGVAEISGEGFEKQKLTVGAGPFQRINFDASLSGIRAVIDGKKLTAEWHGAKPNFGGPGAHPGGDHIAIYGLKNLGDPNAVRVTSTGSMEYTFDNAPSDWKVLSGRWGLLNKWICDPRWSWFGGRTKTCAAIWNKHIFTGDVTVDAHVALLMVRDDPPYERPGDHNITICGDGQNLDSGYTLIFGGDINSWTRLYRKGVQVAEATKEDFRIFSDRIRHPDKPDLHQRWFHLKLEKIGDTVSFYRDGVLAFKYVDPQPLGEGRVGFWTMDNSFLLSRVRIAHGGARPAPFEDGKTDYFDDGRAVNVYDGETPTAVVHEKLPAEIALALDAPADAFKAVDGVAPVAATIGEDVNAAGPNSAFHVVNGIGGGPFALQFRARTIDIEHESVVRFAYRIDPGAMIDFYLVSPQADFNPRHQGCYRWRLTGPKEDNSGTLSDEFAPVVGEFPNVVADGKWHAVQFDLQPSWREFWRKRGFSRAARMSLRPIFGNLDNTGYLLAGMNGNHAGAAYSVTEIRSLSCENTDKSAPSVARVIWPFDPEGDGHSITAYFNEPGGSGVQPETLRVSVDDTPVSVSAVNADGTSAFNAITQCLRIDLERLRDPVDGQLRTLKNGEKHTFKIAPNFADRAGNADAKGFEAEWTFDAAAARKANKVPSVPEIILGRVNQGEVKPGDRPLGVAEVNVLQPYTRVQATPDAPPWAPAGEKNSVEVIATGELPSMGFQMRGVRYDLQNWPYLELDYKVPRETPFNLHLITEAGEYHALLLVDVEDARDERSGEIVSRFGPPADFVADGTWRQSTIPLRKLFADANPGVEIPKLMGFSFHDHGWRGGRRGLHYWIHRVQPVPAGRAEDISVSYNAADVTGIVDVESSIDGSPKTEPAGKHELTSAQTVADVLKKSGAQLKDGWNYIHVRAQNGAGVWSETAHRKFFLDTTPPRIVKTEPADGGKLASQTIRIFLEEEHGVDLSGASVRVDGTAVSQFMEFDAPGGVWKFNALKAGMKLRPGAKVKVEINGLADKYGNVQRKPYVFSFDCVPPPANAGPETANLTVHSGTELISYSRQYEMELSFGLNFEEYFGHVHAIRDCKMEWLNDPALAAEGNRALRFTCLQDDGDPQIMIHKNPWFIDRLPMLSFDYKADPGFKVDLQVEAFGVWYSVRFLGAGHDPDEGKNIGAIPGIVADGTWRHASVDLRMLLDTAKVRLPDRIVNKIVLSGNGEDGCVRGATLCIDNWDMAPANGIPWRGNNAALKWSAKKTPGEISGYALVVDQDATTIAPEQINTTAETIGLRPRTGVWYMHIRACDQAGNWGPDKTIRHDFGRNSPRQSNREFDDN